MIVPSTTLCSMLLRYVECLTRYIVASAVAGRDSQRRGREREREREREGEREWVNKGEGAGREGRKREHMHIHCTSIMHLYFP